MPIPSRDTGKGVEFGDPRLPARFWRKVQIIPETGCWVWTGALNSMGYGQIRMQGKKTIYAHRLSFWEFCEDFLDGMELDHLCRVPPCVNPAHLEQVQHQENAARSWWRIKEFCRAGHRYDASNTAYTTQGHRICLACKRAGENRRYHQRRGSWAQQ